jgi:hypothetical protein
MYACEENVCIRARVLRSKLQLMPHDKTRLWWKIGPLYVAKVDSRQLLPFVASIGENVKIANAR